MQDKKNILILFLLFLMASLLYDNYNLVNCIHNLNKVIEEQQYILKQSGENLYKFKFVFMNLHRYLLTKSYALNSDLAKRGDVINGTSKKH